MNDLAEVLTQKPTVAELPDGSFGYVVRITFKTPRGFVGTVDVPRSTYNAVTARAAVDAHAEQLDAV